MTERDDAARSDEERGTLFPSRLPEFHRSPAPASAAYAVRWTWIPEWALAPGVESRQEVLPFPACNLVIDPEGAIAVGPPTRRSERILRGSGWAVGAMQDPAALADDRRAAAAAILVDWIADRVPAPAPGSDGTLANRLAALVEEPTITRVDQLAERMHLSVRSLQRLAERFLGVSPLAMIRRRRLQEAAQLLREQPELRIADLATELGYADHAHFTGDFVAVLGRTPSDYRRAASNTEQS